MSFTVQKPAGYDSWVTCGRPKYDDEDCLISLTSGCCGCGHCADTTILSKFGSTLDEYIDYENYLEANNT
jgi:hypothetical protein